MKPSRTADRGAGFVLLLTLVLIALAAVVLAATARRSLAAALDATEAGEDLQRRWAQVSLESTLLQRAEHLIVQAEAEAGEPLRSVTHTIRLGTLEAAVTVTDEQAAVNVNTLIALLPAPGSDPRPRPRPENRPLVPGQIEPILLKLVRSSEHSTDLAVTNVEPLRLRLRPGQAKVTSFGQVFDHPTPRQIVTLLPPITCWGDGRLHWRRASEPVMRAMLEREVGAGIVGQLIDARRDEELTLDHAIAQLSGVTNTVRRKVQRHLTDRSSCSALWIVMSNGHRSWYTLTVAERGQATTPASEPGSPASGGSGTPGTPETGRGQAAERIHRLVW